MASLLLLGLAGCEFADLEGDDEESGGASSSRNGVVRSTVDTTLEQPEPPPPPPVTFVTPTRKEPVTALPLPTTPCPERMLEVKGQYCTNVVHRCVKGGRTHLNQPTDEPMPFYCDAYQEGYADCAGREEPRHFCIDEYEYPNQDGAIAVVMVTWYEARQLCEAQNKRLCGDDEWTMACEGPERSPFTYGYVRDRTACNIDHLWLEPNDALLFSKRATASEKQAEIDRLSKRVPSGSMPRCRSGYGVMDMGGNVDEWAVNVTRLGKPFQSVFKGGHWVSGARNRCRPATTSHDETTAYYAQGFRCCSNPGKA